VRFADTNLLLYAVSTDAAEQPKALRARDILDQGDLALSVQVLQEFYVQATRATRPDRLTHEQAAGLVDAFLRFPVQETGPALVLAAIQASAELGISYWDSAILEAARALGCSTVLSEDLAHGRDYGGLTVENPFVDLA
jgi:predicted nucleic acid-binding protein